MKYKPWWGILGGLWWGLAFGATHGPSFQLIDEDYKLFTLQGALQIHSDESSLILNSAPSGKMYSTSWGHQESLTIDFRTLEIEWLGLLHHVPFFLTMGFETFPRLPYADSWQKNMVALGVITPKILGCYLSGEIQSISNSGNQENDEWVKFFAETPGKWLTIMGGYGVSTGSGFYVLRTSSPHLPLDTIWGFDYTSKNTWNAQQMWMANITIDLPPLGKSAYLSYRYESFSMTPFVLTSQSGVVGHDYLLDPELLLQGEVSVGLLNNALWEVKVKMLLTLSTNFALLH